MREGLLYSKSSGGNVDEGYLHGIIFSASYIGVGTDCYDGIKKLNEIKTESVPLQLMDRYNAKYACMSVYSPHCLSLCRFIGFVVDATGIHLSSVRIPYIYLFIPLKEHIIIPFTPIIYALSRLVLFLHN
jgi:hypothetical protein